MRKLLTTLASVALFTAASATFAADTAPKSVIHVVTVSWKADATPAQIQATLDAVKALPTEYKGITRVWTKTLKAQGGKANATVMEFADEAALKSYTDSPAQKKWYETYVPIREQSTTFDITN